MSFEMYDNAPARRQLLLGHSVLMTRRTNNETETLLTTPATLTEPKAAQLALFNAGTVSNHIEIRVNLRVFRHTSNLVQIDVSPDHRPRSPDLETPGSQVSAALKAGGCSPSRTSVCRWEMHRP